MAADDLTAPVSGRAGMRRSLAGFPFWWLVNGLLACGLLGIAGWALLNDNPLGGQPQALVVLAPVAEREVAEAPAMDMRATVDGAEEGQQPLSEPFEQAPADIVITDPSTETVVASAPMPVQGTDLDLYEDGRHGLLPRIASDGRRPSQVFAGKSPALPENTPRIALVIAGMGLSTAISEDAVRDLPAAVSFAFAPYGREAKRLVERARAAGHEILLQVPLEPYDYPDNDPGPHTLLTGLDDAQNIDRLHWLMARFGRYVGITNYMGARFTASPEALRPFIAEIAGRGLIYAEDGSSGRSMSASLAGEENLLFAKADVIVDAVAARGAIEEALIELEKKAIENGHALGIASALPVTVQLVAKWAELLDRKGIALVPITAVMSQGES